LDEVLDDIRAIQQAVRRGRSQRPARLADDYPEDPKRVAKTCPRSKLALVAIRTGRPTSLTMPSLSTLCVAVL